jgi:hypothetical protein
MTIVEAFPWIKAEIVLDEVALQEYEDYEEHATPATGTKYVEAKSGADFAIRVHITPPWPGQSMLFDIYIDGKNIRGVFAEQAQFRGTLMQTNRQRTPEC